MIKNFNKTPLYLISVNYCNFHAFFLILGNSESSVSQSDKTEPPYEQLQNDTDSEVPGYEKIKLKSTNKSNSNNSGSSENSVPNNDTLEDDGIVQV